MYFFLSSHRKKPADPTVVVAPLDDERSLLLGELRPGHVKPQLALLGGALQIGELTAIMRLAPGLDGIAGDRLRRVGHHEIHVELDDVAKPVTRRTRAEWVVEREQPRLRIFVGDPADAALETLRKAVDCRLLTADCRLLYRPRGAAALPIRGLDRISQPLPRILVAQLDPVHDHPQRRAPGKRDRLNLVERHRTIADEQASEPFPAQRIDRRRNRSSVRSAATDGRHLPVRLSFFAGLAEFVHLLGVGERRRLDDRQVESEDKPRPRAALAKLTRRDFSGLAHDLTAATSAVGASDAGEQQPHVVVNLGRRAHGGPRIANAVFLADGDGGGNAVDAIDIGLFHPLKELASVGRQRLDVPALPLGVDRVEGERRFSRPADTGHDDQLAGGQRHVDVLEVVGACAANDQLGGRGRIRSARHTFLWVV